MTLYHKITTDQKYYTHPEFHAEILKLCILFFYAKIP